MINGLINLYINIGLESGFYAKNLVNSCARFPFVDLEDPNEIYSKTSICCTVRVCASFKLGSDSSEQPIWIFSY